VIVESGSVALIERVREGRTYYLFPGGGVEPGETPEEAAVREAREELGVDVELGDLVYDEVFAGTRFLYFRARVVGGEFGTGGWPDHAERAEEERVLSGTHRPAWIALDDLAGKDIRPPELAKLVVEHG
jgi:8-oxo-dGTP pyrophosphatase MutT (NUDIX family)